MVPGNVRPGSVHNKILFYSAQATGIDNEMPPRDNWKIAPVHVLDYGMKKCPDGIAPPPKLSYCTNEDEVIVKKQSIDAGTATIKTITDKDEVFAKQPSTNASQPTAASTSTKVTTTKTTYEDEVVLKQQIRNANEITLETSTSKTDKNELFLKQSPKNASLSTPETTTTTTTTKYTGCIVCNDVLQLICSHKIDPENRLFYQLTTMKRWDHKQTCDAINAYSEFMTLKIVNKDYDGTELSPTKVVDEVWHSHVMDTKAYQSFNSRYVKDGNFIHHDPLKALDVKGREARCKNTITQYRSYFGRSIPKDSHAWLYEGLVDESEYIEITLRYDDKTVDVKTMKFNVKESITFGKIAHAFAQREGLDIQSLRFLNCGERLSDNWSLRSLNIQSGDVIDVIPSQCGC